MRFDKVLITTDFSENSEVALELAAYTAKSEGSDLTVLTVIEDWEVPPAILRHLPSPDLVKSYREEVVNAARKKLEDLWKKCSHNQKATLEVALRKQDVATEITDFAKENKFNVIVIASHGRSALGDFVLGSIVTRVVRSAHCPVLIVPKKNNG